MSDQPTPQVVHSTSADLPSRIAWFERLLYAAAVISVIRLAIDQPKTIDIGALVIGYILLMVNLTLIWLAARRRKLWACWVLLGLYFAWMSFAILHEAFSLGSLGSGWMPPGKLSMGLRFAQMVIEGIGLGLVFSRRGRRWFNPNCSRHRNWSDA